jgi:hypothetical protein
LPVDRGGCATIVPPRFRGPIWPALCFVPSGTR